MSEAMTSELVIEAEWLLRNYWTKMRYAFQTDNGSWSDVDVLSYNPENKHLVVSESKVRGPKDAVYAYTKHTASKYGSILEYDDGNYFSFLRHLPILCSDNVIFSKFEKMVKRVTVQLVSNYIITTETKETALSNVNDEINRFDLPVNTDIRIDTTLDVISNVLITERESVQGRRYGHPVLDIAREINRYFYPSVRYAGRDTNAVNNVRKEAIKSFIDALGISSES